MRDGQTKTGCGNMQDDATKMDDELMLDGVGTRSMKRLKNDDDETITLQY